MSLGKKEGFGMMMMRVLSHREPKKMSDMITIFAELFHNLPALTFLRFVSFSKIQIFLCFSRMMISSKISVWDFIVFGVSLVVPVAIALYNSCVQRQKTTSAVFLADRSLSALPISFSLGVSYLSAVTITGNRSYFH